MDSEEKSKIDDLKDVLYSKQVDGVFEKKRHGLHPDSSIIQNKVAWQDDLEVKDAKPKIPREIPYKKILIISVLFFALAIAFAIFEFSVGTNTISNDKIDVLIKGPSQVDGGQVFSLDISVNNNGTSVLKSANLKMEFPDGTKDPNDTTKDMKRYYESLGDINPGVSLPKNVKLSMFGEENVVKKIKVIVEYRVEGSNAVFDKEKDYDILIGTSPFTINVTGPEKISANQQTEFAVTVKSNSLSILRNLLLKIDYPFGFNLVTSNPKAYSSDGSVFNLGDIEPGGERTVKFTGIIVGQDGEERVLKFSVGTPDQNNNRALGTVFAINSVSLIIIKSSIGVDFFINQDGTGGIAINPGDRQTGSINWKNNLTNAIKDMSINVSFSGKLLDKGSINTQGSYDTLSNTIVFDKTNVAQFGSVNSNDNGNVQFDFTTFSPQNRPDLSFANAELDLNVNIYGDIGSGKRDLLYSGKKILKVSSSISVLSRGMRNSGSIENTGPFPPKAGQASTYTISWAANNSFNNISNGQVVASLPQGVSWTGITSPSNENISYDEQSGNVIWSIGNLKAGTGTTYPAREVEFQVSAAPNSGQIGQPIDLVSSATITGTDNYTQSKLSQTVQKVTSELIYEIGYVPGSGNVVK